MKIGTARLVNKASKIMFALSAAGIFYVFFLYFTGRLEFKFISLPVMFCFISITWMAVSKAAIATMEMEEREAAKQGSEEGRG